MKDVMIPLLMFIPMMLLYVLVITSLVTDRYLSSVEKVFCLIVALLGSVFGIVLAGMYSSHVMKKRFKLHVGPGEERR